MNLKNIKALLVTTGVVAASLAFGQPMMRAHAINVGQASATLYEFPCGMVLVDSGAERPEDVTKLVNYIKRVFTLRPDLNNTINDVILTHCHKDHAMGLKAIAQNFTIKNYIDSGRATGSGKNYRKGFLNYLADNHLSTAVEAVTDAMVRSNPDRDGYTDDKVDSISCNDCDPEIKIMSSAIATNPGWNNDDFSDENNHSVMVRIRFGSTVFLVTGDAEKPDLNRVATYYAGTNALDADVWTVSHHGSENGVTQAFLDAITPKAAIISCGPPSRHSSFTAWAFGHPRQAAIDLLLGSVSENRTPKSMRIFTAIQTSHAYTMRKAIYGTAWDGNVVIEADLGGAMTFKTWN